MAARKEVEFVITARDRTRAVFRRIRRGFSRLRLGLGSFVGGLGFAKLAKDALNFATSIEAMSRRLDVSGDTLEGLKVAAEDDGVAFNNLGTSMQRLSRRAAVALNGNSDLAESFGKLGVGFDVLKRGNTEEIFFAVAEGAKNFTGTLGQLQAELQAVGDTETVSTSGFLRRGEAEIRARIEELRREGRIVGKEDREKLAAAEQKARREILELQKSFATLLTELIPILQVSLERIAEANRLILEVQARGNEIELRGKQAANNVAGVFGLDDIFTGNVAENLSRIAKNTDTMASDQRQSGTLR